MNVLLDTHAFLWWIEDNPRLSPRARTLIADSDNGVYVSAASGWEIAIKARLGKLRLSDEIPLERFLLDQLRVNAFQVLPVQMSHALHVYTLPSLHRDPFDRLLIAQSRVEGMPLVTGDAQIANYEVQVVW
ncbi:MAG: type II toxin-antitoxin system VapC family toxin [Caldilineae bacterium]|nr:MAG: type II toxin-antitoxin system VapC family toxin [Caldilineae bacterium]